MTYRALYLWCTVHATRCGCHLHFILYYVILRVLLAFWTRLLTVKVGSDLVRRISLDVRYVYRKFDKLTLRMTSDLRQSRICANASEELRAWQLRFAS